MKMTEFFMRRPVLFWSLMAAILVAGVLAFVQMPKLEDPAVSANKQWWWLHGREPAHTKWS